MASDENGSDAYQDAYVFVTSGTKTTISALYELWAGNGVRYVARPISGAYGAVVFVEAPKGDDVLTVLRDRIAAVRDAINPGASVGVALQTGPMAPTRWSEKQPVGAYVRIRTAAGRAGDVFDAVNALPGDLYAGSALVIGDWDVLLELGAPSLDDMKRALLERVNPIDGVVWTDTAIVINDIRKPIGPPAW